MNGKLFFVAPNYYGFNEVVFQGLKDHSGFNCFELIVNQPYIYKNFGEKIINFFSKNLLNRNLKNEWIKNQNMDIINQHSYFDVVIINRPDVLNTKELNLILKKSKKKILLLWDSLDKINLTSYLELFDEVFSFDSLDCEKFNLKKITNFYWIELSAKEENNYDVAYLGTYDARIETINEIFKYFRNNKIFAKGKIFKYKSQPISINLSQDIEIIEKIVPFKNSYKYYLNSKCILDIAHQNQVGLSFRPFEAMGLNKKIITTNKEIVNYDFYNQENIFIIENFEQFEIPNLFFKTPYRSLSQDIYKKYSIKSWVNKILNYE